MAVSYLVGVDVLGGGGEQYLLLRIKNIADLVKKRGGFAGGIAIQLAPQTIEKKVYDEISKEMIEKFRQQGVDVETSITSAPGSEARGHNFLKGMAVGAGAIVLLRLLVRLVLKR
jgi:hypothetical protein